MAKINQNSNTKLNKWIIAILCIAIAVFTLFGGATLKALGVDNPVGDSMQNLLGSSQDDDADDSANLLGDSGSTDGNLGDSGNSGTSDDQTYTLTISFYDHKLCEEVHGKIDDDIVKTFTERTSFEFTVDLPAYTSFGEITYYSADAGMASPLSYSIDTENHKMTVSSDAGLYENTELDVTCGEIEYEYEVHYFFEDADGNWTDDYYTLKNAAPVGTQIPTTEDIETRVSEIEGIDLDSFSYDGKGVTTVVASFDNPSVASVYYRRNMIGISFNDNSGFGGPGNFTQRAGSVIAPEESGKTPTRAGYSFKGWYNQAEGGTKIDIPETGYVVPNDNTILYAQWELNSGQNRMSIVYWGQNADVDSTTEVKPEDYTYVSQCYVFGDLNTTYEISDSKNSEMVMPHYYDTATAKNVELTMLDLDGDGVDDANTTDCYYTELTSTTPDAQKPVLDGTVTFDADNLAIYNVYLKRHTYTWEFYDGRKSSTKLGSITARWGQYIYDEYSTICKAAWPEETDIEVCPWYTKENTFQFLFSHMSRENRTGVYKEDGTGGYAKRKTDFPPENPITVRYYLQNIDADDDHPNIQSKNGDCDNYYKITEVEFENTTNTRFTSEELFEIEGFVAPSNDEVEPSETVPYYSTSVDCPYIETTDTSSNQQVGYTETDEYVGWNIYYKRAEHILSLCAIQPHTEVTSNNYWEEISNVDYNKVLGDIDVPDECLGTFVDSEGKAVTDRKLRHYIPEVPDTGTIDPNYVFDGWTLSNNRTGESINLETTEMPTTDLCIYAKWKAPEVSVKFNQVSLPKTEFIASSTTLTGTYNTMLEGEIPTPTEFDNYYFEYWYYYTKDANGNDQKVYYDPSTMTLPAYDVELFPEYSQEIMATEYAIRPLNTPIIDHGTISPSSATYTVDGNAFEVDGNTVTIENSSEIDVTYTATPTDDSSGTYEFVKWQVQTESGDPEDLYDGRAVESNLYLIAKFQLAEEKPRATITTEPVIQEGLVYNGSAQNLLSNNGEAANGKIMYAVGSYDDVPEKSEFTEDPPTAITPGHITVYYYVAATEGGYIDSEVMSTEPIIIENCPVTVSITMKNLSKPYKGSSYSFVGDECYQITDIPQGFDKSKVKTQNLISLVGTDIGTYDSICIDDARFYYDADYYEIDYDESIGSNYATLTITDAEMTDPTLTANFEADGSDHALITTEAVATYGTPQYAITDSKDTAPAADDWTADASAVVGKLPGTYVVWVRSADASGTAVIAQKVAGTVLVHSAPELNTDLTYDGANQALIINAGVAPKGTMYYQVTDEGAATTAGAWTTDVASIVKKDAGTYDIHFKITTDDSSYTVDDTLAGQVDIAKFAVSIQVSGKEHEVEYTGSAITAAITDLVNASVDVTQTLFTEDMIVYPTQVQPITQTAPGTYETVDLSTLEWASIQDANFNCTFSYTTPVKGKFVIVAEASIVTMPTLSASSDYSATAKQLVATAGVAKNGTLKYGVSTTAGTEPTTWDETYTNITGTTVGTYYVWYKVDTVDPYTPITATLLGQVKINQKAVNLDITPKTITINYDGAAHTYAGLNLVNIDNDVEIYDTSQNLTFDTLSVSGTNAGSYSTNKLSTYNFSNTNTNFDVTITYSNETAQLSQVASVLTISKVNPTVEQNPVITTNWVYDAASHGLISTAGTAQGGTFMYAISEDDLTAEEAEEQITNWKSDTSAIAATDVDNYYIYSRVKGDSNHLDISATKLGCATPSYSYVDYSNGTLSFDYKDNSSASVVVADVTYIPKGAAYAEAEIPWADHASTTTTVDITPAFYNQFAQKVLTNTSYWFKGFSKLTTITGTTTYTVSTAPTDTDMFSGCTSLVGGNGTTYDATKGFEYLEIDGPSKAGYMTYGGTDASTITYNYNGGTAATGTPAEPLSGQKVKQGTQVTVTGVNSYFASNSLTKANHKFAGWKSSEDNEVYDTLDAATVTSANVTFTAQWDEKLAQQITPSPTEPKVTVDETTIVTANGILEGDDANLTWTVKTGSTDKIGIKTTYDNSVVIEGIAKGTATLVASTDETATYKSTDKEITVEVVEMENQDIKFWPEVHSIYKGELGYAYAYNLEENPTITWTIQSQSATDVIELEDGAGSRIVQSNFNPVTFKGLNAGTAVIKISVAKTEHYLATEKTISVTVNDKLQQDLTFNKDKYTINVGNSMMSVLSGAQEEPRIVWEVVDTSVAKVEYEGEYALLTGLKAGSTQVKVTTSETDNYASTVVYANIEVNNKASQDIQFDKSSYSVVAGGEVNVTASNIKEDANITWTLVSGGDYGSLTYNGDTATVKGIAAGEVKIAVTAAETENYGQTSAIATITVTAKPSQTVSFDKASYSVYVGGTAPISITGTQEDPRITWEVTSGEAYASVKYEGTEAEITGIASGTAAITATVCETESYSETTISTTVTVSGKPSQTITFDPTSVSVDTGSTATVTASGLQESPTVTWSVKSGSESIFSIEGETSANPVTVKGLAAGTGTLVITVAATESYAKTTAEVGVTVNAVETAYLKNRDETTKVSIFNDYLGATSVKFTSEIPSEYVSCSNVDINNSGIIKAYKVADGSGYKLVIASNANIAVSETSCIKMFKNFSNLQSVDFGSLIFDKSENMGAMFSHCPSLERIELKSNSSTGFNTSNVTNFSYMFDGGNSKLTTIVFGSGFTLKAGSNISTMFDSCTSLSKIVVPEGTDWSEHTGNSEKMFNKCNSLPNFNSNQTNNARAFEGTKGTVKGYFVTSESSDTYYITNRDDSTKISIFADYEKATSVEFTHTIPASSISSKAIDTENSGTIKSYKVDDGNGGYKLVVASTGNMAVSQTSCIKMFKNFVNLTSVSFGDLNFDNADNMGAMFSHCSSLERVELTSSSSTGFNTSNVTNFSYMFDGGNTKLTTIIFGNGFTMKSGADMSYMFKECSALTHIVVAEGTDWSTSSGKDTNMFYGCTSLPYFSSSEVGKTRAYVGSKGSVNGYFSSEGDTTYYLVNRNESTKVSIFADFAEATSVTFTNTVPSVYISNKDVGADGNGNIIAYKIDDDNGGYKLVVASNGKIAVNKTSCIKMFKNFTKLKTVDFGDVIFDRAENMGAMFSHCCSLERIELKSNASTGFDTSNVTNFSYMFDGGNTNLQTIVFGTGFNLNSSANIYAMFADCSSLTSIVVAEGTDWSSHSGSNSDLFRGCSSLPSFDAAQTDKTRAYEGTKGDIKGYFVTSDSSSISTNNQNQDDNSSSDQTSSSSSEEVISTYLLMNRDESTKISIFSDFSQATSVQFTHTIPSSYISYKAVDNTGSGLINAYKVDDSNGGYKLIVASKGNIAVNKTSCIKMFKNFTKLKSVDFGDIIFDNAEDMGAMFSHCTSLESINLVSNASTGFNTQNVKNFSYMFDGGNNKLTKIVFGDGFVMTNTANLYCMFAECSSLSNIFIAGGTDWSSHAGNSNSMFRGCSSLPFFSTTVIDATMAYNGSKNNVVGYFSTIVS